MRIHPTSEELAAALCGDGSGRGGDTVSTHLERCETCRREADRLLSTASVIRAVDARWSSGECLRDDEIAAVADGVHGDPSAAVLSHVASCARCSHRVAQVVRLLNDHAVASEVRRHEAGRRSRRGFVFVSAAAGGALAAVLAGILLRPVSVFDHALVDRDTHRESASTATVAPRIVGPVGPAGAGDTLRWTVVPHADLYRVRVFDREGTLVWDPETRDTALAIPSSLIGASPTTYLWKVEARTGWDRWVASEWTQLNTRARSPRE